MKQKILGKSGLAMSAMGLGCMGMSEFYGSTDDAESARVLARAVELGITFFDTADTYGMGHNETLLANALHSARGKIVIATKFGISRKPGVYERTIDNSAQYVRKACEESLRRLNVETIDLYYAHRIDPVIPIEETVGAMAELVQAGKVRALGLCEVSGDTLRRAYAVHPIVAVQSEYSLWSRDPERELLPACRELDVAFVAYSPLGRGMLTGGISTDTKFADNDFRNLAPRFQSEHRDANLRLVEAVKAMAQAKGCTAGQISLAWLLAQGEDIVPIPGTKRIAYLEQNVGALNVELSEADVRQLGEAMPLGAASGARYPAAGMKGLA